MNRTFALALLALTLTPFALSFTTHTAADTVRIDGGMINGAQAVGVRSYKGIPFAAPPVGNLRWKPPQPVVPWEGVRQANAYGPECPQAPYAQGSIYYRSVQPQSEDCLCLNVWTTARPNDKQPVMIWIHGGALTRGSGSLPTYDGTVLAKKGVVLVTINYRLGPLGYLAHPELTAESAQQASGNYGVLDQIAALQWVRKNIAAFGGDPGRVTIFGESAGSWSVNALVATPLAKGLFHRAIGESGASFNRGVPLKEAENNGAAFGKAAGAASLSAMRALAAGKIIDVFDKEAAGRAFRTVVNVDGWVLPREIRAIFQAGKQNNVPLIAGSNANEMTTLTAPAMVPRTIGDYRKRIEALFGSAAMPEFDQLYPAATDADAAGAFLGASRDITFTLGMRTWVRMTSPAKAWLYSFSHVPPGPDSQTMGAYHAAEIAYVFGNLNRERAQAADHNLSARMLQYWVNFATTGDPNGEGLPAWMPYQKDTEPYMDFSATPQQRNHLLKPQLDMLERLQQPRANGTTGGR
ncbi:MAG: carboxylesterase/lipase family protein [Blastocatellia bacterium]